MPEAEGWWGVSGGVHRKHPFADRIRPFVTKIFLENDMIVYYSAYYTQQERQFPPKRKIFYLTSHLLLTYILFSTRGLIRSHCF